MLNKKLVILLVVVIVVLIAVAVWVGVRLSSGAEGSRPSAYSAVMLANGDVYFGKLSWFPNPKISGPWALQRSLDANNQLQLNVVPLNQVFWGPVNEINLNSDQIVFWTRLRRDSQLVRVLENPSLVQQMPTAAPGATAGNVATSTPGIGAPPAGR